MLDDDHARLRQEKATNCTFVYFPEGGELGDRKMPSEDRRVVLRTHLTKLPSNYANKTLRLIRFANAQQYSIRRSLAVSETGSF